MDENCSVMILTGGRSTRFGSDKSKAQLGEQTLLAHLLSGLPSTTEIVIVGPVFEHAPPNLRFVQENPRGGGPVAALHAGIDLIDTEFVALIATDMPFAVRVIRTLFDSVELARDGVIPLDREGVAQTLCAIYRTASLRRALTTLGNPEGRSMRSLAALLDLYEVELPRALESSLLDIDRPEELDRAIAMTRREDSRGRAHDGDAHDGDTRDRDS